jgi:hypothetical protein
VTYLECTVAVICPHYHLWEKVVKSCDVYGLCSSSNLLTLTSIVTTVISTPAREKCWRSGRDDGEALMSCALIRGGGAVKRDANMSPDQSRVLSKHTPLLKVLSHVYSVPVGSRESTHSDAWTDILYKNISCEFFSTCAMAVTWCDLREMSVYAFPRVDTWLKSFLYAHITEHNQQNILILELALFHLNVIFQLNNWE